MEIRTIITGILLFLGCFIIVVASIGIVRFPDFYSRMHPAGKSDTLGQLLVLSGLMVYEGFSLVSIKLLIIIIFIFIANPTATHALAKAAYAAGLKPWKREEGENK
jgi:multicomponent Na+:H+ antiporter subunit G